MDESSYSEKFGGHFFEAEKGEWDVDVKLSEIPTCSCGDKECSG
jgi:hypothetical protein